MIGGEVLGSGGGAAHGAARNSLTAAGGERAAAAKDDVAGDGGVARSLESLRTAVPSAVALYHDGDVPSAAIAAAGEVEVAAALGASHATTAWRRSTLERSDDEPWSDASSVEPNSRVSAAPSTASAPAASKREASSEQTSRS